MNWDAWILAAVLVGAYLWIEHKLTRIIGELKAVNETLASILNEVEK
jgi:hypothetical protein